MTTMARPSATQWAREHGKQFDYRVFLDNYDPPREFVTGKGAAYDLTKENPPVGKGVVLFDITGLNFANQAIFLLDDGEHVDPFYVAAYKSSQTYVILHRFPLDGGVRPDTGQPVSMAGWALGPRRAYHLKVEWK